MIVHAVTLIVVCAWCDNDNKTLGKGQEYSHGICEHHKQNLLKSYFHDRARFKNENNNKFIGRKGGVKSLVQI